MSRSGTTQQNRLGENKDFEELGLDPDRYAGLFISRLRENTILVRNITGMVEADVIVHEYVHYLLNNDLHFPYPKWYQEGYAEYISSSASDSGRFKIGNINDSTMYALSNHPWLPIEMIIDSSYSQTLDDDGVVMFYSQSWLLTHYLLNKDEGEADFFAGLQRYAAALQGGASEIEAFETGFGMTLEQLQMELINYHGKGKYTYFWFRIEPLIGDFAPQALRLTKAQISAELAGLILGLQLDEPEHDEKLLAKARQLYGLAQQDEQMRARAEVGLAYLLEMDGKYSDAEDHLVSATTLAPANFYVQLDAARFWLSRLDNDAFEPDELAANADPYLRRALAINNSDPEAIYTAGKYMLAIGNVAEAIRVWKIALAGAPAARILRWELANALIANGQPDEALIYARALLLLSHGNVELMDTARRLIERIEEAG